MNGTLFLFASLTHSLQDGRRSRSDFESPAGVDVVSCGCCWERGGVVGGSSGSLDALLAEDWNDRVGKFRLVSVRINQMSNFNFSQNFKNFKLDKNEKPKVLEMKGKRRVKGDSRLQLVSSWPIVQPIWPLRGWHLASTAAFHALA